MLHLEDPPQPSTVTEELRFPVMGTMAHVIVVGGPAGSVTALAQRAEALEAAWSRFRPDSEISRWNAAPAGIPFRVGADTLLLVQRALDGAAATDGVFDPTLLDEVRAAGYAESIGPVTGPGGTGLRREVRNPDRPSVRRSPGECISVDPVAGTVTRAERVGFDPGGIGKGLAADLLVEAAIEAGAEGALANLGGDLRVEGPNPDDDAWSVAIEDPRTGGVLETVLLSSAGLATSSRLRRRWTGSDGMERHHLIDPLTGRPAQTGTLQATAIAGAGWQAEVLAKAAFLDGVSGDRGLSAVESLGAAALVLTASLAAPSSRWSEFVAMSPSESVPEPGETRRTGRPA